MSYDIDGFNISYHTINGFGYDDSDSQGRKFRQLEKKGYHGFTVSDMSKWELRKIRKWVKQQSSHVYMSAVEDFHTTDNGGYKDNCVCLWFSKKGQKEVFVKFLDTFPERKFVVDFDVLTVGAKEAFEKNQFKSNRRLVFRNREVTAIFDDVTDAVAFKLEWL